MKGKNNNHTSRIGSDFNNELEEIRIERFKRGKDYKRIATWILTDLITKHEYWKKIKEDMINYEFRKG